MTTSTETRRELLDRYTHREAIGSFIVSLEALYRGDPDQGDENAVLLVAGDNTDDLGDSLSAPLFMELWPQDGSHPDDLTDYPEYEIAAIRANILTARLFARLADNPEWLRREADRFMGLAQRHQARLHGLVYESDESA